MKHIFAVCPNPSVDVTISVGKLKAGELNRAPSPVVTYSGKAINALKAAVLLGAEGTASGFIFDGDRDAFEKSLADFNCGSAFVASAGSVRRNIKICEADGTLTELNTPGPAVGDETRRGLIEAIEEISGEFTVSVISGSLPAGCGADYYGELSRAVKSKYKIVDAEGERLISALSSGATLIKPNRSEAEKITGIKIKSDADAIKAMKALINLGASAVLLSAGGDGAYISDGKTAFYAKAPKVTVRSSVGSGDCMVGAAAAFLSGFEGKLNDDALYNILRSAVAAGSASVVTPGTNLFEKAEYDRIYKDVKPVKML